jgi:two-component system chemotaxis sensor kinase CheA
MDSTALASQLMATFLDELEEHVRVLNVELLALEREPVGAGHAERLSTLLRTAHSLKGAARAVNLGPIEAGCHHLEDILTAVRDGTRSLETESYAVLFATADAFDEAAQRLRAGRSLDGASLTRLLPQLERSARGEVAPAPTEPAGDLGRSPRSEAPSGVSSVRIAAERLDALLAHSGELLVAWHRLESRRGELGALRELVSRWKAAYRRDPLALRSLLDASAGSARRGRAEGRAHTGTWEMLHRLEKDLERLDGGITQDGRLLGQAATRLSDDVHRVRMLPFAEACAGLERVVRDLGRASGKQLDLLIDSGGVELDRSILEALKDPLLHLVRNAVDHGVETPALRRAAAKTSRGRITVSAALCGDRVEVVVEDDGRGLDLAALREQVRKKGLAEPTDERELARVVFEPGFSTATLITDVSGRGLGLDVVKNRLEALNGTVDLSSQAGRGTRFILSVPLTLTTVRTVLFTAGGQVFALAGTSIDRVERVRWSDLDAVQGRRVLTVGASVIPVVALADVLAIPNETPVADGQPVPVLIVASGETRVACVVDQVLAEHEIVVKSLGPRLSGMRAISGGTILPSGAVALLLNAAHLVRNALGRASSHASPESGAPERARARVLVVDDSITIRALQRSILEAAGYEVTIAVDGDNAWQLLQERGTDLIVSDVEMPCMDGFELTAAVRGSPRFRDVPVVLVTGRESDADKARGMQVGANAYLVKSAFDQTTLLDTIAQLL